MGGTQSALNLTRIYIRSTSDSRQKKVLRACHCLKLFLKEDIYGNNAETVLDETEYVAEVKKETNWCKIKVGIPWDR